jgi:hypothetical protein
MTPIGRYPAGLLELLGSKTGGAQLTQFEDRAQFGLDITNFFGTWEVQRSVDLALAEASSVFLTVPDTTWWRLVAVSMHVNISATQTGMRGSIRLSPKAAAFTATLAIGSYNEDQLNNSTAALGFALVAYVPAAPLIIPPASTIWATLDLLGTDATLEAAIQALVVPLN